jgi:hypothetical protein
MITSYKNLKSNTFYLSNNPCFPGQIFYVEHIEEPTIRFTKQDSIVTYKRLAFSNKNGEWYLVCNDKSWASDIFGIVVPDELTKEVLHLI